MFDKLEKTTSLMNNTDSNVLTTETYTFTPTISILIKFSFKVSIIDLILNKIIFKDYLPSFYFDS